MLEIDRTLCAAFAADLPALLIVGEERAARALLRALAEACEECFAVCAARDAEGWPAGPGFSLRLLEGEVTPLSALRSALRMDPDFLLFELAREELTDELFQGLATGALTGHGLAAAIAGCPDEAPLLAALAPALALFPAELPCPLPRILVAEGEGLARVVDARSGAVLWRRGEAAPAAELLSGREPRRAATPPPREPTPPLEEELLERLRAVLEAKLRPTWVARLGPAAEDAARAQLGGRPLLLPGEAWPACGACGEPMPLALQLARAESPAPAQALFPGAAQYLQLFYCSSSGCGAPDAWEPFASNRLLRFLEAGQPAAEVPTCPEPPEAAEILGWDERLESPSGEDLPELESELEEARWQLSERVEEGAASPLEERLAGPGLGNRLLGWPHWAQGAEWPACPRCAARMALVFQIDANEGPLATLFAGDGTGHVTQCPTHPEVLAFAWACG